MYKIKEKFKNFVHLLYTLSNIQMINNNPNRYRIRVKGKISINLSRTSTPQKPSISSPWFRRKKLKKEKRGGEEKRIHFSRKTNATMVHPPPFQTISISHPALYTPSTTCRPSLSRNSSRQRLAFLFRDGSQGRQASIPQPNTPI